MAFFNTHMFWFIEGILFCLILLAVKYWAEDKDILMTPLKWTSLICWLLWTGFSIAFITTSLGENEPQAAKFGALIFGLISIISFFGIFRYLLKGIKSIEEKS